MHIEKMIAAKMAFVRFSAVGKRTNLGAAVARPVGYVPV